MPKTTDNNQIGRIVLFLKPIPNSLMLPSVLYKKDGFSNCMEENITTNKPIDTDVMFSLMKFRFIKFYVIYNNYKNFLYLFYFFY